jgi:poly(A) polymerase
MNAKTQIDAQSLGLDLASKKESPLFRWLLACLLFGKPIQQKVAQHAYEVLTNEGITSLSKLVKTDWNTLVTLLDQAHYVRYDFSSATKLLDVAYALKADYGSVNRLVKQSTDTRDLEKRLIAFKGIGPITAAIFIRDVAPVWFGEAAPHDYELARNAAMILSRHGFEAYFIGGAVRDLWLNRHPKDFDLVTNATPELIMKIAEFKKSNYKDTAQAFGVTRVKFTHQGISSELEIATFRKDIEAHRGRKATKIAYAALEDDVLRRDFTINALAFNPSTNQVIDYVGGIDDLDNRVVRFIGKPEQRIQEDPLRIMRSIRFKNQLGFTYHPETILAIKSAVIKGRVETIATDRLRDELTNLLIHPSRRQAFSDLDKFGILERILREVTAGKDVSQPPQFHSEGNVWQHELLILDYLPPDPSKRLVWAALLHDIGKGPTSSKPSDSKSRIRFNRHYAIGSEMAKTILIRLKFSNHDMKDIVWIIYNHMAIDDLPSMRPSRQQNMLGHPAFEDLLELHRADAAASWRPGQPHGTKPVFREIEHLWHTYQSTSPDLRQPSLKRDLGIDGKWLLKEFGEEFNIANGPMIGKVLSKLDDWYRNEGVRDQNAYKRKARQLLKQYSS